MMPTDLALDFERWCMVLARAAADAGQQQRDARSAEQDDQERPQERAA